ncbi:MAG: prephenate/arogenate dehydrogenase family protein [Pseudomonadota bacterium]
MLMAMFERVALIGLGLIASSIAHGCKRGGLAGEVVGTSRSVESRQQAAALGYCTVVETPEEAVKDADLVIICTPVGVMGQIAEAIAPHLKAGAIVSDVGSVKRRVVEAIQPHIPEGVHFVPAHPVAGTEQSGPTSGFAELFDGRWLIITPVAGGNPQAVAQLRAFWEALGSNVTEMDAEHHDLVLAVTSHAPHLIAYTMVGVADDLERITEEEVITFSAAGFRDFTRIAASDPTMWRDVFLNNKSATMEILGRFTEELLDLQRAIRNEDGEKLHAYFTRTRDIRRGIIDAGQDTSEANFGRNT